MSDRGAISKSEYPIWAMPVIDQLVKLDEADAKKGAAVHDGLYLGYGLKDMADLYTKRFHAHQPGIKRIFEATLALDHYIHAHDSLGAWKLGGVLIDSMFEGAAAVLNGRAPDYKANVPGLSENFIREEFESIFSEAIYKAGGVREGFTWKQMWIDTLDRCRTDIFLRDDNCPF